MFALTRKFIAEMLRKNKIRYYVAKITSSFTMTSGKYLQGNEANNRQRREIRQNESEMKRSRTMDKKEEKINKLAKICGLKKSHTLPARKEHDESQKLRGKKR